MLLLEKNRRKCPWKQLFATTLADSIMFKSRFFSRSTVNLKSETKFFPSGPAFSLHNTFRVCSYDVWGAKPRSSELLPVTFNTSYFCNLLLVPSSRCYLLTAKTGELIVTLSPRWTGLGRGAGSQQGCAGSILVGFQDPTRHSPEQPGLSSQLGKTAWTKWFSELLSWPVCVQIRSILSHHFFCCCCLVWFVFKIIYIKKSFLYFSPFVLQLQMNESKWKTFSFILFIR